MRWVDINSFDSFSEVFWTHHWLLYILDISAVAAVLILIVSYIREKE